jgi:hypothetical protein
MVEGQCECEFGLGDDVAILWSDRTMHIPEMYERAAARKRRYDLLLHSVNSMMAVVLLLCIVPGSPMFLSKEFGSVAVLAVYFWLFFGVHFLAGLMGVPDEPEASPTSRKEWRWFFIIAAGIGISKIADVVLDKAQMDVPLIVAIGAWLLYSLVMLLKSMVAHLEQV